MAQTATCQRFWFNLIAHFVRLTSDCISFVTCIILARAWSVDGGYCIQSRASDVCLSTSIQ